MPPVVVAPRRPGMSNLEETLQQAMVQARRTGCVLSIDYRPADELPWWIGSVTVHDGTVTGIISEVDGLSLHDVLTRWIAHSYEEQPLTGVL
jgi:hypothetical protein